MLGKVLASIGIGLLFHAAYYTVEYARYVALSEIHDARVPPVEALIELVVAFVITLLGVLDMAGSLKPIRTTDYMCSKSFDSVNNLSDFYTFNHRGKALKHRRKL